MSGLAVRHLLLSALVVCMFQHAAGQSYQPFAPVPWPSSFRAYTVNGEEIKDPAVQDPSNGGTSPQSYANISSGVPDQSLASVFFAYENNHVFIRFRVESNPNSYSGGSSHGHFDPWQPIKWTMLLDLNGDGWRDFAIFLAGNGGVSGDPLDPIQVIYSTSTTSQSIDHTQPNVHLVSQMKAAKSISSGPYAGQLQEYDGSGNPVSNPWPNGRNTTLYDYGTTRVIHNGSAGQYFVDFQLPISMLDASGVGGPTITPSTVMTLAFSTANSNVNPFQKDFAYIGAFCANAYAPMATGDLITFEDPDVASPLITSIVATACPTVTLTANVQSQMRVIDCNAVVGGVDSVQFYYWPDGNGNGVADGGEGSWTYIASGSSPQLGMWTTTWNTAALPRGQYLVKVVAYRDNSVSDSYDQEFLIYTNLFAVVNNSCGVSPPTLSKTVNIDTVASGASALDRTVTYTITVNNPTDAPVSLATLTDALPPGFAFDSNVGGTLSPTTSPTNGATGSITWSFSPSASIPATSSRTLSFKVVATSVPGTYSNTVTATGSVTYTSALGVAPVTVIDVSASLSKRISPTGTITPGNTHTYTVTYQNTGTVTLNNVVITDSLAVGFDTDNLVISGGGTYNSSTRVITWNIGTLASGASGSLTVAFKLNDPFDGLSPVTNRARLVADQLPSGVLSNIVTNSVVGPDLSILKEANISSAVPGSSVTFTLTYGNSGSGQATGVAIVDTLPSTLTYVSGSSSPITPSVNGQILTWSVGTLLSGSENNTITFIASVVSPYPTAGSNQVVSNSGYIFSNQTAPEGSTASVNVTATPYTLITKTADSTIYSSGSLATYTITLQNLGNAPATVTQIVDTLPSTFTYSSTTGGTINPSAPTVSSSRFITWSTLGDPTIPVNGTRTLIFKANVGSTSGSFANKADATGILRGATSSTISNQVVVGVIGGGDAIAKVVDRTSAFLGDTLTYIIRYTNNTGTAQPNRNVIDTLGAALKFVSQTTTLLVGSNNPSFSQSGNILTWSYSGNYANGSVTLFTVKAVIKDSTALVGTTVNNRAHVRNSSTIQATTGTVSTLCIGPN